MSIWSLIINEEKWIITNLLWIKSILGCIKFPKSQFLANRWRIRTVIWLAENVYFVTKFTVLGLFFHLNWFIRLTTLGCSKFKIHLHKFECHMANSLPKYVDFVVQFISYWVLSIPRSKMYTKMEFNECTVNVFKTFDFKFES